MHGPNLSNVDLKLLTVARSRYFGRSSNPSPNPDPNPNPKPSPNNNPNPRRTGRILPTPCQVALNLPILRLFAKYPAKYVTAGVPRYVVVQS